MSTTIADALARPRNGFAVVRLGLALAVVVSHAFSVTTGRVGDEPLVGSTGFTLGEHAVNGFFAVSGFLVTMSFARRGWRDYVVARALRIAPGLVAATLGVGLVLGAGLTSLAPSTYFTDPRLWAFVSATLTTFKSNTVLPGVFDDNPFRFPMGTVWTLKYEVICYVGVLAAGLVGLLRNRGVALMLAGGLFAGVVGLDTLVPGGGKGTQTALRLPFLFAAGAALWLWRERVPATPWIAAALVGLAALASPTPAYAGCLFAAQAYGVIWLALSPGLAGKALDLRSDLSYGVYLYGWPIQQALKQLFPGSGSLALLGPALLLTLAVALASWRVAERPALALKDRLLRRRPLPAAPPAAP